MQLQATSENIKQTNSWTEVLNIADWLYLTVIFKGHIYNIQNNGL